MSGVDRAEDGGGQVEDLSDDDGYPVDDDDGQEQRIIPRAGRILSHARRTNTAIAPTKKAAKAGRQILQQEKQRKALELRKGGATYEQIATAVGYSDASGSRKAVVRALKHVTQEPVMELKTLQIERLNHMLLTMWPKVQQGDERAIDTSLRVMDKIDALMGTHAAQKIDINVNQQDAILVIDGNKDDYIAAMRRMVGIHEDGTNKAIEAAPVYPIGADIPMDADIIEDMGLDLPAPVIDIIPAQTGPAKKVYKFGMEPTVRIK